jgi:macrodomain Ter protein organizer (MatP/YcbG family)
VRSNSRLKNKLDQHLRQELQQMLSIKRRTHFSASASSKKVSVESSLPVPATV